MIEFGGGGGWIVAAQYFLASSESRDLVAGGWCQQEQSRDQTIGRLGSLKLPVAFLLHSDSSLKRSDWLGGTLFDTTRNARDGGGSVTWAIRRFVLERSKADIT